jgi:general stress protein 26|tara:strand:- start:7665 stop:8165 length:501 start_codon:yes stop_codon:yes gene_type:complete
MSTTDVESYDDVTMYGLTAQKQEELLLKQNELTFIWTNKEGHGMGVTMSYIWRKGRIWCTATEQRARMKALARDPRCSVVISSAGVDDDLSQSITFKGHAILHKDQPTKDWFYPDFARRANNPAPTPEAFGAFLDTPARIIIEVVPEKTITFDGGVMRDTTTEALK